ncbi:DUF1593 domain-containing protein [Neobacillus cucumis]|uniref:DUF1593 domain-containing protein n=1 Tax=Neobacillus cucumis TaxID=1740721 RepID=UPI001963F453|nr:DUF1593 domain-containing protein [Neobacillus cucumis]MBM7655773.1 hypothetical protein [Neobacillus cucumis]
MKSKRMRRIVLTASLALTAGVVAPGIHGIQPVSAQEKQQPASVQAKQKKYAEPDKSSQTRMIITTDGEVDDQNSLRHLLLYADDFDIAGIVYSSSMYHWQGDGVHTLKEIAKSYKSEVPNEGDLKIYRPQPMGWIEDVIKNEYAKDYKNLVKNDPKYPSPDALMSVVKVGNVEFEGDVRNATEGSELIKKAILDNDPRKLYIQTWGGFNTTARALLSIADEYKNTPQWKSIQDKVVNKVIILAHAQDNTWTDYDIPGLYPGLVTYDGAYNDYAYFGSRTANAETRYTFQPEWLTKNIIFDHGKMMSNYHTMGDGTYYPGEPDNFQYGLTAALDWRPLGYPDAYYTFDKYEWLGEGDSLTWFPLIPVGLRGLENPNYGTWGGRIKVNDKAMNKAGSYLEDDYVTGTKDDFSAKRFLLQLQQDWAARSDWAVNSYEDSNHAPVVSAKVKDITAKAGDVVTLEGNASDPDGNALNIKWWVYKDASEYSGAATGLQVWDSNQLTTKYTVPKDAVSGDYFNIVLEVSDNAKAPMTRYAQVIVKVQ